MRSQLKKREAKLRVKKRNKKRILKQSFASLHSAIFKAFQLDNYFVTIRAGVKSNVPLSIFDIRTRIELDNIAKSDSEICSNDSRNSDLLVRNSIVRKHDTDSLFSLFAFQNYSIASEQLKLVHFCLAKRDNLRNWSK